MLHLRDPYDLRLADGAPVSPGPIWILFLAPITLLHGAGLLTGISALVFTSLLYRRDKEAAGLFSVFLLLQPVIITSSAWGTDLFAIPIVFGILCVLADRWAGDRHRMIALGIFTAVLAESRLPMVALGIILACGIWRRNKTTGMFFAVSMLVFLLVTYAAFFLWAQHDHVFFQPLHLLNRERHSGLLSTIAGPVLGAATLVWSCFKMKGELGQWLLGGGLLLTGTFAPTGFGELANVHQVSQWEGAHYVSFGLPLLAAFLVLDHTRRRAFESQDSLETRHQAVVQPTF